MRIPTTSHADHSFSRVPKAEIPRSSFDRSHGIKTTFNAGWLVPFYVDEVLPGDTFNANLTAFTRLATPLFPFMDNIYLDTFFFFVPNRLVWSNWEKFNGEQDNPADSTSFLVPQQVSPASPVGYRQPANWLTPTTNELNGALADYMGIPTNIPGLSHNALPLRAYNLIYNDWFRDQNIQNSAVVDRTDGPDTITNYVLRRRGKRHDYFTSALPFPQKGPAVSIPLTGNAPIRGLGFVGNTANVQLNLANMRETAPLSNRTYPFAMPLRDGTVNNTFYAELDSATAATGKPLIYADLSAATAATINQLRQSFQLQKLYERDARGGTRYTEIIQAHFGVISDDARLQRPEYLGGGSSPIVVNPVAQTSAVTGQPTPQGNLAAIGTGTIMGHAFTKSFTEHGYVIGLISARADLTYQQGLNRMWTRSTRFDYYWPALSHIGEQAVQNREIFAVGSANLTQDLATFGFQERYAEYRYKPSQICAQFRSNFTAPLDTWHLAQNFLTLPTLNATFIEENPPINRVIAVTTAPHFIMDAHLKLKCARPMPVYSVPGLIDHF
ncbi:MAG: major capsid protein [Microvirus sp.]|nr:MAG: major capsid protein [Microvirus sp.]